MALINKLGQNLEPYAESLSDKVPGYFNFAKHTQKIAFTKVTTTKAMLPQTLVFKSMTSTWLQFLPLIVTKSKQLIVNYCDECVYTN